MQLSIVVPVYNVKPYLEQCVNSALTLKTEHEIILVDDGSTDGSEELCDKLKYENEHIVVIHQKNSGLSAARNIGISNSTGDYIMFLDSDDFIDPGMTDKMLDALESRPDVLVGLYNKFYTDDGSFVPEKCGSMTNIEGLYQIDEFLERIPRDGQSFYMVACRFIIKRSLITNHDLLFLTGIYHEDEEWTARLLCSVENIYVSPTFFYQYRQNRTGAITSTVKPKHIYDCIKIVNNDLSLCALQESNSVRRSYLQNRMGMLCLNIILNLHTLPKTERKKIAEDISSFINTGMVTMNGKIGRVVQKCFMLFGYLRTCEIICTLREFLTKKG